MTVAARHYVVIRDLDGDRTAVVDFGPDRDAALRGVETAEREDADCVLLSAGDLETLMRTHPSWFLGAVNVHGLRGDRAALRQPPSGVMLGPPELA